jgi:type VI secretion system protein VasD
MQARFPINLLATSLWLAVCLAVVGCAGAPPTCKVPSALELEIETSDRVNRDGEGRSLPTVLRIYQVTDVSLLQMAAFDDMLEKPKETLAATLVASDELTIYPGQITVRRFERNEKADFLVIMAVYRNPIGTAWRTIEELPIPSDPCQEQDNDKAAPKLVDLRIRAFMEDYRIESINNYAALPKRSCAKGDSRCQGTGGAPDELPEELRHRRLRSFQEDPSRPTPTVSGDDK